MRPCLWLTMLLACLAMGVARAATIEVAAFGDEGWMSDDTRGSTATDLVGLNYTHYPKPGQTPTVADDAVIAQQIQFLYQGPELVSCLMMSKASVSGGYSKCTLSEVNESGFATGGSWVTGFFANYRYYTNSTGEAPALKLGIQSTLWGTGAGQSQQSPFTAQRSGEPIWDLILVDWRGTNPPWTVNAWDTFTTDKDTDCWMVYRQAGNSFFSAPPGVPQSLADWAAETDIACTIGSTPYTWAEVLFGTGAKVVSAQFGVGSSAQTSDTYIDYIETSLLNGGDRVDFSGPEPPVHNVTQGLYYFTIQAAVDDAGAGDVIEIAAGTYEEQVHIATAGLTLDGAGVGATTIKSPTTLTAHFGVTAQSYPVVFIDGVTGVTLTDLTVDGAGRGNSNYRFVGIGFWSAGGTVSQAEVIGVRDTPFSGAQHGVGIYSYNNSGSARTIVLDDVDVTDFQKNAIALLGPNLAVDLDDVTTIGAGATSVTAQNGIQVGAGAGGTVENCEIRDVAYTGTGNWTASGFLPQGGSTIAASNLDIDGCQTSVYWIDTDGSLGHSTITGVLGDAVYAYSSGAGDGSRPRRQAQPIDEGTGAPDGRSTVDFTMSFCTLTGAGTAYSWGFGPYGDGPVNCTVENCWFDNWDYGIYCYDAGGLVTAVIHGNSFTDSGTLAIENEFAALQDASGNWFGTAGLAAVAALVGANIDYTPWMGQDGTYPVPGFDGDHAVLWVDDDSPQSGAFGRVQEGIDLVSGSTVNVAAGTYREQLRIDGQSLTLDGAGIGATIIEAVDLGARSTYAVTKWTGASETIDPCIGITGPATVHISDLTLDGRELGPNHFYGIYYFDADGSVTHCRIEDITYAAGPSADKIVSLVATHSLSGSCDVNFSDNEIPIFQKGGILLMGPEATCTLNGNTIVDSPSPTLAGNGIQVSYGATGALTDNDVSGVGYTGPSWSATGILLFESGSVDVSGGLVDGCQTGVGFSQWNWIYPQTTTPAVAISGTEFDACEWSTSVHLADTGSSLDFAVTHCRIHDGTASGIDLWGSGQDPWGGSYYGPWTGGTLTTVVENCTVDAADGVVEYIDPTASGNTVDVSAHYNDLSGNGDYGAYSNYAGGLMDARHNWWGDATGPNLVTLLDGRSSPSALPSPFTPDESLPLLGAPLARQLGLAGSDYGVNVSPYVDFDPWIGTDSGENVVCVPDPLDLSAGTPTGGVDVRYLGGGADGVYGYSIEVAWDTAVITADENDFERPATGPFATAALFEVLDVSGGAGGHVRIDAALGGAQPGTFGPADLFHFDITNVDCGTTAIDLTIVHVRNRYNQPVLGVYAADGEVRVDLETPAIASETLVRTNRPNNGYAKDGDDLRITANFTDGCLTGGALTITADLSGLVVGGSTAAAPTTWVAPTATWVLSGVDLTAPDGTKTVTLKVVDAFGNQATATVSIYADNTPPAATVSGFTALPQHNEVALSWTNPSGGDPNRDAYGILLRRVGWGDYPLYNLAAPAYPGSGGGTLVREASPLYSSWVDAFASTGLQRDIYYYQAFVFDAAYNYSAAAISARDRSTNYWLGDVSPRVAGVSIGDGVVGTADISALGGTYGKSSGAPTWNPHCDVGPTDDGGRLGIPVPDDLVNFEDLMIFAMNFGVVAPDGGPGVFGLPVVNLPAGVTLSLSIDPAGTTPGEIVLRVLLADEGEVVQGTCFAIDFDPAVVAFLGASVGAGAAGCDELFFHTLEHGGVPEVSVAALGQGATLGGTGELAVLRFRRVGAGRPEFALLDARVRNCQNRELLGSYAAIAVQPPLAVSTLPTEVFLAAAQPNPCVHATTIAFGLPSATPVNLAVYDVSGRLVRTLVAGEVEAGEHRIDWNRMADNGSRVASGIYFCRLQAGSTTLTRRMVVSE
jgi:hypothetical protein